MEINKLFQHYPATEITLPKHIALREAATQFAGVINEMCPESADKTAAVRKVREALFTANAAIALDGK
jgi:hypothetical protein